MTPNCFAALGRAVRTAVMCVVAVARPGPDHFAIQQQAVTAKCTPLAEAACGADKDCFYETEKKENAALPWL